MQVEYVVEMALIVPLKEVEVAKGEKEDGCQKPGKPAHVLALMR